MAMPKTPCGATIHAQEQPEQSLGELLVISFACRRTANRVAPQIVVEAPLDVFVILNQLRPHLYVNDRAGGIAVFMNCTVASGPHPIVLLATDVRDSDGGSLFE
jgi:hypothetical protein